MAAGLASDRRGRNHGRRCGTPHNACGRLDARVRVVPPASAGGRACEPCGGTRDRRGSPAAPLRLRACRIACATPRSASAPASCSRQQLSRSCCPRLKWLATRGRSRSHSGCLLAELFYCSAIACCPMSTLQETCTGWGRNGCGGSGCSCSRWRFTTCRKVSRSVSHTAGPIPAPRRALRLESAFRTCPRAS